MCTPDGYVFTRDAIIENLAAQKKANKRKLAAWEEQQDDARRKVRPSAQHQSRLFQRVRSLWLYPNHGSLHVHSTSRAAVASLEPTASDRHLHSIWVTVSSLDRPCACPARPRGYCTAAPVSPVRPNASSSLHSRHAGTLSPQGRFHSQTHQPISSSRTGSGPTTHGVQLAERAAVAEQTQLLAFDRQNHMGVSSDSAASLSAAICEEAEALLADKRVVGTDVAIDQNKAKIKVSPWQYLEDGLQASSSAAPGAV